MSETEFALLSLGVLLIASNWFWAWSTHSLINKLMSRNYSEFKAASVTTEKPKDKIKTVDYGAVDDMAGIFN